MDSVLLVDSNKTNLDKLKSELGDDNYNILSASEGLEALKLARENPPKIIITEIELEGMDGFKLCYEWKRDKFLKDIPLLFFTQPTTNGKERKFCLFLGAEKFLIKPYDPQQLKEIVNKLIEDSRQGNIFTSIDDSITEDKFLEEYDEIMATKERQPIQTQSITESENVCYDEINDLHGLESMFDNLSIGLYRTSVDGNILRANTPLVKLLGFNSLKELKERDLDSEGFGHSTPRNDFKTIIEEKGEVIGLESCWKCKDGTEIYIRENAKAIKDDDGKIIFYEGSVEDITEHKIIEEALQSQMEFDNKLIQNTPVFFVAINAEGNTVMINDTMLNATGYTRDEVLEKNYLSLFVPEKDHYKLSEIFERLTIDRERTLNKNHVLTKENKELLVEWHGIPMFTEDGNFDFFLGMGIDITEQTKTEEALNKSKEKYKEIVDWAHIGIYQSTLEGKFISANECLANILGDESANELTSSVSIKDLYYKAGERERLIAAHDNKKPGLSTIVEVQWKRKDGNPVWLLLTAREIKDNSIPKNYYEGFVFDITEKKQTEVLLRKGEERYKSLYENATVGLYRSTPAGKIIMANPALLSIYGFSSFEELSSVNAEDIYFDPSDRTRFKEILQLEGTVYGYETTGKKRDGSKFYILDSAKAIKDEHGKTIYYEGVVQDITEQKFAVESLTESEKKFRQLIEQAPNGIFRVNSKGNFILVNTKGCELLGYTEEEIYKLNILDTYSSAEEQEIGKQRLRQLETGKELSFERTMRRKDGSIIPVEALARRLEDGSFQAIIQDITERKRSEFLQNAVYQISEATDKAATLDKLFESVHKIVGSVMPADNFFISLYDAENDLISFPYFVDELDEPDKPMHPGNGYTAFVLKTGKSLFCNEDEEKELREKEDLELIGVQSPIWLGVPLIVENITIGVMVVQHYTDPDAYTQSDLQMLEYVSSQIAKAIVTKRAEETLIESEYNYRRLINLAPNGIFRTDEIGNFILANKKMCELLGYTEEEIYQLNIIDTYSSPEEQEIGRQRLRQLQIGEELSFECNIKRKDGKTFPVESVVTRLEDKSIQAIIHDITSRKRNEFFQAAVYRISEATGKAKSIDELYKSVHEIIGSVLPAKNFFISLYDNEKDLLTFPYFVDEIDSPPGPVKAGKGYTAYVLRTGKSVFYDEELDRRLKENGEVETVGTDSPAWIGVPLIVDNETIGAMVVQHYSDPDAYTQGDLQMLEYVSSQIAKAIVTKRAEEELLKLSSAVKQSSASIIITDILGNIEYVNPKFTEVSGYPLDEVKGINTRIMKSGETPVEVYKELWATISEGKEWKGEFHNKKKNGELYWESTSISAIRDADGMINHFLAVKEDITEKKRIQKELIESKEKAEEMSRLKSTFLANMSHELRTPLVGILGYAEIIEDEIEQDEQKEMINTIISSGNRLMNTINSILDLSKIEAENHDITLLPTGIVPVITKCLNSFKSEAISKNIELKSLILDENAISAIDESLIEQIMRDLLSNAIKYVKTGSVEVIVDTDKDKRITIIKVQDTGIGISNEDQEIIFDEFRQASEGLGRQFEGAGLGLTITKKFVELMDGQITVESEPGKGSVFTVTFPAYGLESDMDDIHSQSSELAEGEENTGSEETVLPRILLVEDDNITRQAVKLILKNVCSLDSAADGASGVSLAEENKYELIVMDINLGPGISGLEATKAIRKIEGYKETPIVALTAYAMSGDEEQFLSEGCTHYLSKPFSKKDIVGLIEYILMEN